MAGAGAKKFPAFSKLSSDDVNNYLADQVIMRFATTTARDAAFGGVGEPTLAEGMTAYIDDTNAIQVYDGSNWVEIASALTKAPRGVMGYAQKTNTQSFTTRTDVNDITITFNASASRIYEVSVFANMFGSGNSEVSLFVTDGTTDFIESLGNIASGQYETRAFTAQITGLTAGSKTIKLQAAASVSTTIYGNNIRASIATRMIIKDIGAA